MNMEFLKQKSFWLRVLLVVVVWVIPTVAYYAGFVGSEQFKELIANPLHWYLVTILIPTLLYIEMALKTANMQHEIDVLKKTQ